MSNQNDFVIENGVLIKYTGDDTDVVVPEGVTIIGNNSFEFCELTSVVIPDGVTAIGGFAFAHCKNLISVSIPDSVTRILDNAFIWCDSLKSLKIPNSVTKIPDNIIMGCSSLTGLTLPESINNSPVCTRLNLKKCSKLQWVKCPVIPKHFVPTGGAVALLLLEEKAKYYALTGDYFFNNLDYFAKPGSWNQYDLELINGGPKYKYKPSARIFGALGRLLDPVEMTDEIQELYIELLNKNAKKLVPLAEEMNEKCIIEDLFLLNILEAKNEKAVKKLLAASTVTELAALA